MVNNVNCIMGTVRSGKTSKLIDAFITKNTDGKLYNTVFITCEENVDSIRKRCAAADIARSFGNLKDVNYNIIECSSREEILNTLANEVSKKDTLFFIDMPELYIEHFALTALSVVGTVPNNDCKNEMSITWTKSKPISSRTVKDKDK